MSQGGGCGLHPYICFICSFTHDGFGCEAVLFLICSALCRDLCLGSVQIIHHCKEDIFICDSVAIGKMGAG